MTEAPQETRVFVAGYGVGVLHGRTPDGAYVVAIPHMGAVYTYVPSIVFELGEARGRPLCHYDPEPGHA